MKNAKKELQDILEKINKTNDDIMAYNIIYLRSSLLSDSPDASVSGKGLITEDNWDKLGNIEYTSDYGSQHLYGLVLFTDNSWLERGEYDGSEWWEYKKAPTVWEVLKYDPRSF